jgi:anaerobic magnesium-protoporphyrin IX monomethyl ester cyclase
MNLNVGIVTLNAKYIHTSLSLRYLRNAARNAGFMDTWISEYEIDKPVWKIAADIQNKKPEVVGISVYIWNRVQSFQLIEILKKQNPRLTIIVGGPEVSFEDKIVNDYFVIGGEGESKWVEALSYIEKGETPDDKTLNRWKAYGNDLPELTPPYTPEDQDLIKNRISYIETSRGCPYLCSFCLSALDEKVRYFDDTLIKEQIEFLVGAGVKTIKFIDRTFNLKPKRVMELMTWLIHFEGTSFHFEVVGDILTEEILKFLETVPEGMFQFEIGIQTADERVQESVHRKQRNEKLFENIRRLLNAGKIHLHCDLIFGLPGETLKKILNSFNSVFELQAHELQLGFLKFLPGAPIREVIEKHEYEFQSFPPYETISHKDLSADEIIFLKKFADVFELFYNSKRFRFSISYLLKTFEPSSLFRRLLSYMEENDLINRNHSLDNQYKIFAEAFNLNIHPVDLDLLRLDFAYSQRAFRFPEFLRRTDGRDKKYKVWSGDKKSPLFPFSHDIDLKGGTAVLKPSDETLYYAFLHPEDKNGYISDPVLVREIS